MVRSSICSAADRLLSGWKGISCTAIPKCWRRPDRAPANLKLARCLRALNRFSRHRSRLTNLQSLQASKHKLDLDSKAVVKQILNEVVKIMAVVHTPETFTYFGNLIKLKTVANPNRQQFENFRRPENEKKSIYKDVPANSTNNTLHNYFQITLCGEKRKCTSESNKSEKRLKQMTLPF